MKRSIKTIGTSLLLLVLVLSAIMFFKPFGKQPPVFGTDDGTGSAFPQTVSHASGRTETVYEMSPGEVAALFAAGPGESPGCDIKNGFIEPAIIDWIEPCGYYIGMEGRCCWFLENSRTQSIILLSEGGSHRGWRLVSKTEGGFLLEHDGKRYIVRDVISK